jgi:uncharacterized protein (TIGR03905 family)
MKTVFIPEGTCSTRIELDLDGGVIRSVAFTDGCDGNARGLDALLRGMDAREAVRRLKGISCEGGDTSCPDQLARAIERALAEKAGAPAG